MINRRIKLIVNEIGNPFHIQVAGAWVLVFAGLFVYLSDAFLGFGLLAAVCAGIGVVLIEKSASLKAKQDKRKRMIVNSLEKKEN
jgi:Zn-dependent membrane protease YugP